MILLRAFDERAVALQRQGRIGNYPSCWGEEATQVAPLYALRDQDWVFPTYRQQFIGMFRGIDPSTFLKYRRGYGGKIGFWNPREYRVAPICISIATHLPHAVGLAWAARIAGDDVASLAWFGDGATSEGDFHEALNFGSVQKTPTIFWCTNNQWAISTPFARQTFAESIVIKAEAYGIRGIQVDGFDAIACWEATKEALSHVLSGEGPVLVEALTYRIGGHATADDPSLYRDQAEAEKWRAKEPIARLVERLRADGAASDELLAGLWTAARDVVDKAVEEMESAEPPGVEAIFETTYASGLPWTLKEGLDELHLLPPNS
ncbi:MAG: pyruvate dehydrogenase component alpha subunit [Actinomycetota bacterium]|nr:pyruvate dehydrogenase component alpha subunit [Actinomycetota bacterium]